MFGEAAAKRRAESPDAHWLDAKRAMGRNFQVSADLLEARPGGGAAGQVGDAVKGWLADAERYGKTGRPRDGEIVPPHQRAVRSVDGIVGNYHLRPDEQATSVGSFVTVVRIEQDAEGAVVRAAVIAGSGLPAYDAIALARAREAAKAGPPPPGQERTDWAFETDLVVVPPLPIAGCSVYADFTLGECYYPTKRIVRSRVRLVAVQAR